MNKLSNLISKPVYSLYEGVLVGNVISVCVSEKTKKIKAIFVLSDEDEKKNMIALKNIFSINDDCILIRNVSKLAYEFVEKETNLINKQLIALNGENYGQIKDVFFDENFNLLSVQTNKDVIFPFEDIISIGQDACFVNIESKRVHISWFKPKFLISNRDTSNFTVKILDDKVKSEPEISLIGGDIEEKKLQTSRTIPVKIAQNPNFLIGRKSAISIRAENGEYIVKAGEMITEKIISKAQLNNKIYELSVSAN